MATRFRKGMNPRALREYWTRLRIDEDEAAKAEVERWIRRIHDSIQPAFVSTGVKPEDLLKNADARRQIEGRIKAGLAELPAPVLQQSPEHLLKELFDLYRFFRCAFPAQWGLIPAAPRRKQTAQAQSALLPPMANTAAAPAPGMAADMEQTTAQALADIQAQLAAIRAEIEALRERVDDVAVLLDERGLLWEETGGVSRRRKFLSGRMTCEELVGTQKVK
ncbi:hypothetical protein N7535_000871 [Penicillium sp. DV-2018c]|nr:hypothetical protein N7535_000871 [Penicillium sp. DV-2018c]